MNQKKLRRGLFILLAVLALSISVIACSDDAEPADQEPAASPQDATASPGSAAPDVYTIHNGWSEPDEAYLQYLRFYPNEITIHAGDTIDFVNHVGHTVTFMPEGAEPPPLVLYGQGLRPINISPCVTQQPITSTSTECPETPSQQGDDLPEYVGTGFYSTGLLADKAVASVRFSESIAPGTKAFFCPIHPGMEGVVEVVDDSEPTATPDEVERSAMEKIEADTAAVKLAREEVAEPPTGTVQVGAMGGTGEPRVSINTFFDNAQPVTAGTTVTWVNDTPEPHTVAFGTPPAFTDPAHWGPPSQPSGSDFIPGTNVFAGHLDPTDPNFPTSYSLRFNTPGNYVYVCTIHPGMNGVIEVTQPP